MKATGAYSIVLLLIIFMPMTGIMAQNDLNLRWKTVASLPAGAGQKVQPGLAGAIIGISNENLILAGGANFGDTLPWKGGIKKYHDEIFLMNLHKGSGRWELLETRLPANLAYSACTSIGGSVISIGGEGQAGPLADVFTLTWTPDGLLIETETPLPEKLAPAGAAVIGNKIYVAGGYNPEGASGSLWCADAGSKPLNWQKLPSLPSPLSHALVIAQNDGKENCLFVIGGRNKSGTTSTFYSTVWKYVPSRQRWEPSGELTGAGYVPMGLSAGTGVPVANRYILIIGGDIGKIFNQTEELIARIAGEQDPSEKEKLTAEKNTMLENHPGFTKQVLLLDCHTGLIRRLPDTKLMLPVTTTAVIHEDRILIPSGEIRPGVRTPQVISATVRIR